MRGLRASRTAATLAAAALLALGLWHCSEGPTVDAPGSLHLSLSAAHLPPGSAAHIDSIEIEILQGGRTEQRQVVVPDTNGAFRAGFALPSEELYAIRVHAWGAGSGAWPDESVERGVVAAGLEEGVEVPAGRQAEVRVELAPGDAALLGVDGSPGVPEIHAWWARVPGATTYQLVWFSLPDGPLRQGQVVADTQVVQAWDAAAERAGSDSVLFRVRPGFGERPGVSGSGLWRDLSLWLDLPRLTGISPEDGAVVAAEELVVELVFDRPLDEQTLDDGLHWARADGGGEVPFAIRVEEGGPILLIPQNGSVAMGTDYRVQVTRALHDLLGRPFDADSRKPGLQDSVVSWSTAPYAPLQVAGMDPAPGETGVARDRPVAVVFNRPIAAAGLDSAAVYVTDSWGWRLSGGLERAPSGDTLRWLPDELYWYATACTVHVTPRITDLSGKPLDQDEQTYPGLESFTGTFTTLAQPLGPAVAAVDPADSAQGVASDAVIRVEFSEAVDPLSVRATTLRVLRAGSVGIPGEFSHDAGQRVFTFTPSTDLELGQSYEVSARGELSGGVAGIVDGEGHPLDQDPVARGYQPFTSRFRVETPLGIRQLSFSPAGPDTFIDAAAMALLSFTGEVDAASLTSATVQLRRAGTPVPAALAIDAGSRDARLTPAETLAPLARYSVWVDTLVRAPDGSYFDDDPGLPHRQAFERFFTCEPESLHPQVGSVAPPAGDSSVAPSDSIRVTFTVPVDPATVGASSFTVSPAGEGPVAGEIRAERLAAVFRPLAGLAPLTDYEVRVTSAVLSETHLFALDQDPLEPGLQGFSSGFRTDVERIPPRVSLSQPAPGDTGVAVAGTTIRLTFSEPLDEGTVAGAFGFASAGGAVGGAGGLEEGGLVWAFEPDEPLAWRTAYTVSVDTTAQDLWGNGLDQVPGTPAREPFEMSFTTEADRIAPQVVWSDPQDEAAGVDVAAEVRICLSEPLARASVTPAALHVSVEAAPVPGRSSLEPGDTVVAWSAVTLPDSLPATLAWGTRYTVTAETLLTDLQGNGLDGDEAAPGRQPYVLHFTTEQERVAPRVTAFLPGMTDVPVEAGLRLAFSEPMDPLSLEGAGVVTLVRESGEPLDFAAALLPTGDTLEIQPAALLAHDELHRLDVDTLATDLAGNALDQEAADPGAQGYTVFFRTVADEVRPYVVSVVPRDDSAHVPLDAIVELRFSEPLDEDTVTGESVFLYGPGGSVPLAGEGQPELDGARTGVTLRPRDALEEGGSYSVQVTSAVSDENGNTLQPSFSSDFSTGRSPEIVWADGICPESDTAQVAFDAHASYDPDGDDAIAWAVWDWGDGARDSLAAPAGLTAAHTYACRDFRGCDGLDNDGDGTADEPAGDGGCDESYPVALTLWDTHGFAARDTAGVSFCAFLVRDSSPHAGDTVAVSDSVRLLFTRRVDPASLDFSLAFVELPDSAEVPYEILWRDGARTLILVPDEPFSAGEYQVTLDSGLADISGTRLDQDPCVPGRQALRIVFAGPPARRAGRAERSASPPGRASPVPDDPSRASPGLGPPPGRSGASPRR